MNVFCDTTVLVAASLEAHIQHMPARAALARIHHGGDKGFTAAHCLAETFSVLSRMPTVPKLSPNDVLAMIEKNVIPHFTFITLVEADYQQSIRDLAGKGF